MALKSGSSMSESDCKQIILLEEKITSYEGSEILHCTEKLLDGLQYKHILKNATIPL
jgi:hypothetical protein